MRRAFIVFLLVVVNAIGQLPVGAQQIPFLSELLTRYEEFNRLCAEKRRARQNLSTVEASRKRVEEAFKRGDVPGLLQTLSEGRAALAGKKWDDREKFIASLTLETDRLVIEPNQVLQVSLTRMFPVAIDKAFTSSPTVTFAIVPAKSTGRPAQGQLSHARWSGGSSLITGAQERLIIAERLAIGETSGNAARKLLMPDGHYMLVARIDSGSQLVAEITRPIYAISNFTDSIQQISKSIAAIKSSSDPAVKTLAPLVATPEFQLQRLAQLNKTRGDVDINPNQELDRTEALLSALTKGRNPFADERGEIERAYRASDGKLVPYRVFVPKSYDGANSRPLVVLLHGALGDERYFFSSLFDPALIKGDAERRGFILAAVNGKNRFGISEEDVFEVIAAVNRDYKIDASKVHLAGHSTGGVATWVVAASKPETFAAVAAVSGGPPAQADALAALLEKLKGVPAMLAHGAQDVIAPVQLSRNMASSSEKAGLKVIYLEVPDGDHFSVVASTFSAVMDFFEKNSKPAASK